jgi:hypothetical protein
MWHRVSTVAVVGALVIGANLLDTQGVAQGVGSTPNCMVSGLTLGVGRQVSPLTGERAVMFTLTNQKSACKVTGYPGVTLRDSDGRKLAFTYTHTSSYVTKSAPKSTVLAHGATVYFLVAKYRCDKGDARTAKTISVSALSSFDSSGPLTSSAAVIARFTYCKGGSSDPGQRVGVSPVTATWASALPANQYPNGSLSACSFIDSWPKKTVTPDVVAAVTKYYADHDREQPRVESQREATEHRHSLVPHRRRGQEWLHRFSPATGNGGGHGVCEAQALPGDPIRHALRHARNGRGSVEGRRRRHGSVVHFALRIDRATPIWRHGKTLATFISRGMIGRWRDCVSVVRGRS